MFHWYQDKFIIAPVQLTLKDMGNIYTYLTESLEHKMKSFASLAMLQSYDVIKD